MKKLILVDGYSFFFRAYFALKNIKKRSDGLPVNGIYGFTKMLMNLIVEIKSSHIAVIFDTGKKTFRHEIFSDYKANRPPVPDDMIPQFPFIREVVEVLNIKTIEKDGYEADDIIATLTKKAKNEGCEVWIISGDKDLMQLVDENVFIYETKDSKKIGINEVKEKWGVEPNKLLDVLSLMGDKADNVSGVPSIGEKGAVDLVNEFGSIENIINNLDNIKQEKRKNAIKENIDKLLLSKKLITLCDSVDLNITIDDLLFKNFDSNLFKNFLYKMEFYSIAKDVERVFSDNFDKIENNKYKKITNLESLKNIINVKNFIFEFLDEKNITFYYNDFIFYVCLSDNFDLIKFDGLNLNDILNILKDVFENKNIKKVSFNIKESIKILKKYNININNYDDIGVMSYVLDNGKHNNNLSDIVNYYLENNIEIKIKNNHIIKNYENGKHLGDYFDLCCLRVEVIDILYKILNDRIIENEKILNLYNNIEKPLIKVIADMEYIGVKLDVKILKTLSDSFLLKIKNLEEEIYKIAGENFNINSPKQLSDVLFNKLCLPKFNKMLKSNIYPTDVDVMENLYQMGFEIAGKILEYKHYTKLRNTYTDTLQKMIDNNSRVHTNFSNTSVITGRLSSNNPNLQNIPIRTEDGEEIRKAFVSKDGYSFVGADYSQIELRILAEYASVERLKENFINNLDIHSETAKIIFNTEEVTKDMRRIAKAINFSIVYGTTSYGLAKRLDKTNNEAKDYIDNYFKLYPEIKNYMENIKDFTKKNGYVETMFGRICYIDFNGSQKSFSERLAINAPIQGTGADIIKIAMIKVYNAIKKYDANIVLQIHDELLIEVKDEFVDEVKIIVKNEMESVVNFGVKLLVEVKTGKNWADVH